MCLPDSNVAPKAGSPHLLLLLLDVDPRVRGCYQIRTSLLTHDFNVPVNPPALHSVVKQLLGEGLNARWCRSSRYLGMQVLL